MGRFAERSERSRWDDKHRASSGLGPPSSFLLDISGALPSGRCLDLAAGRGANALFMAERGYDVEAVDWSFEGLSAARTRGSVLKTIVADLTDYPLPKDRYDVVLCFRYLDRNNWSPMIRALRPCGALVIETFTMEYLKIRSDFPETFCLKPDELRSAFPELRLHVYRENKKKGLASLLSFKPSRK